MGSGRADADAAGTSPWNSLEITKIIVAATTPLAIAILGFVVSAGNAEQARLSRALDRRLEIWDTVGPKVRQIRDQAALIYMNSAPRLPRDQRRPTGGSHGIYDLMQSVDEKLEVRPFFTPDVMQRYLDFSACALELAQTTEVVTRPGSTSPDRTRLGPLWQQTDRHYAALIRQVRVELSTEATYDSGAVYPTRETGTSSRDDSACLDTEAGENDGE
jgi:hypothetical protein